MTHTENTLEKIEQLLLAQKRILNVAELSSYTGFSHSFIYKLTARKSIPFSKPHGKLMIFDREKIDDWLLSNEISPIEDVEQEAINYINNHPFNKGGAQ